MTESQITSRLLKQLRDDLTGAVVFKHNDRITSGIPDFSVTCSNRTSWWECKLADPQFCGQGLQELMMLRLAAAGYARYVVWEQRRGLERTLIVHPKHIGDLMPEAWCVGFDHRWLVEQIRKAHSAHG